MWSPAQQRESCGLSQIKHAQCALFWVNSVIHPSAVTMVTKADHLLEPYDGNAGKLYTIINLYDQTQNSLKSHKPSLDLFWTVLRSKVCSPRLRRCATAPFN